MPSRGLKLAALNDRRKNKHRFAKEIHLPHATLVIPNVRQEVQTILVSSDPMVVTGFPGRPAGVGEWLPLLHPLPLILNKEIRSTEPNSICLVVCLRKLWGGIRTTQSYNVAESTLTINNCKICLQALAALVFLSGIFFWRGADQIPMARVTKENRFGYCLCKIHQVYIHFNTQVEFYITCIVFEVINEIKQMNDTIVIDKCLQIIKNF